jgi:leucine dehydrogenase
VIAGGANNQLATPGPAGACRARLDLRPRLRHQRGGIINVAAEIRALEAGATFDPAWVEAKLARLMTTLDEILRRSAAEGRPTQVIAGEIARARLAQGRPASALAA